MRLKGQAPCKALYRNKVIHPAPQPSAEGPAALPFYSGGHGGSVDKAAAGGLCPREAPRLPQGPPGTLLPMGPSSPCCPAWELSLWAPGSLQHEVMDLPALLGAPWGLLPQQLAQPHVAEAILGCHVFALCPFAAAWTTHHKDDRGT